VTPVPCPTRSAGHQKDRVGHAPTPTRMARLQWRHSHALRLCELQCPSPYPTPHSRACSQRSQVLANHEDGESDGVARMVLMWAHDAVFRCVTASVVGVAAVFAVAAAAAAVVVVVASAVVVAAAAAAVVVAADVAGCRFEVVGVIASPQTPPFAVWAARFCASANRHEVQLDLVGLVGPEWCPVLLCHSPVPGRGAGMNVHRYPQENNQYWRWARRGVDRGTRGSQHASAPATGSTRHCSHWNRSHWHGRCTNHVEALPLLPLLLHALQHRVSGSFGGLVYNLYHHQATGSTFRTSCVRHCEDTRHMQRT